MKRFFSFLLISTITVVFLLFTGCDANKEEAKLTVKESLNANYDALTKELKDVKDFQKVSDYLAKWAKENKISVKTSNDKYIVLSKPASEGYEDAETFTIQSSIALDSESDKEEDLQNAAAAMALMYSADNHGTLKAIFTSQVAGKPVGANALNEKYLKCDNFIQLDYNEDSTLYNSIAASSNVTASRQIHNVAPKYTKAYKINLEGTPYRSPYKYRGDYPNAIKTIGDLLASCQSSSVLFELASFKGGEAGDLYPKSATAIIVLQENDVESFTSRFEHSYEKVEDYYDEIEEPFKYTMTETKLPDQVISTKDTDNIVSLMYTITNGTYLKSDKGDVLAVSNIGRVTTKYQFRMDINAKSLENSLMSEMHTVFQTTCGLCDIKYKETGSTKLWYASSENKPLIKALSDSLGVKPSGTLENIDGSAFLTKKANLNLAILGTNRKNAPKQIDAILEYMGSFSNTQK